MLKNMFALSFGFAALIAATQMTRAQGAPCAEHAAVVERLASGYGESRQSIGLAANNAVLEVYASLETGTWTILVTMPGGPTCLVASGEGYEHLGEVLAPAGQGT